MKALFTLTLLASTMAYANLGGSTGTNTTQPGAATTNPTNSTRNTRHQEEIDKPASHGSMHSERGRDAKGTSAPSKTGTPTNTGMGQGSGSMGTGSAPMP